MYNAFDTMTAEVEYRRERVREGWAPVRRRRAWARRERTAPGDATRRPQER